MKTKMANPDSVTISAWRVAADNNRVKENKNSAQGSAGNNLNRRKGSTSSASRAAKGHRSTMMKDDNAKKSANN